MIWLGAAESEAKLQSNEITLKCKYKQKLHCKLNLTNISDKEETPS